jgi:hypothetical protein
MLEIILHPNVIVPKYSNYNRERANLYCKMVNNPRYLLDLVDTGMVSNMAYGVRVRKV